MKKVIMCFTAIGLAFCAQAAAVKWGSGTVYLPDGTTKAGTKVTAYFFDITAEQYATYSADTSKIWSDKAALTDAGVLSVSGATQSGKTSASAKTFTIDKDVGSAAYAALLYTYQQTVDDTVNTYYIASVGAVPEVSSLGTTVSNLGTGSWVQANGGSSGGVPEPTSALLLLMGGAMLALRRKQK